MSGDQSVYEIVQQKLKVVKNQTIISPTDSYSAEIEQIANELISKYLSSSWEFQWKRMTNSYGKCFYSTKKIALGYDLNILGNREKKMIVNTILHEIAHALVGSGHGHDSVWRNMAIKLGCDGKTLHSDVHLEKKYLAICPSCKCNHQRNSMPRRQTSCGQCSSVFNPDLLLVYKINPNYINVKIQRKHK